ncbi:HNH endonuclease [uncultured virus]|nr:HNH endonuclease [uncultured virus]
MNNEIWKILSDNQNYEISNLGNLRNCIKKQKIKKHKTENNYYYVIIFHNGKLKRYRIDYLVAKEFVKNDDIMKKKYIKHLDNDNFNNIYTNLEWVYDLNQNEDIEWKDIKNFESKYQISNNGEVRNKITGNILVKRNRGPNYIARLYKGKRKEVDFRIDFLVASHFLINNNPELKTFLEHIDGNLFNDNKDNLKWIELRTNENEIWKDIKNYENLYQISNFGEVRSIKSNIIMSKYIHENYYAVSLTKTQKSKYHYIHKLVAIHFIENDNIKNKIVIDHIDNNKLNNYYSNLRWATIGENNKSYIDNFKIKDRIIQLDRNKNFIKL